MREILEETGLRVKLLGPLTEVRGTYRWLAESRNVDETVTCFLAEPMGGRLHVKGGFDGARWATKSEALRLLRWKDDRDIVLRAFDGLAAHAG